MSQRTFTVHEANRLLPQVRVLTGQISELTQLLPELEDDARIKEYRSRRETADSDAIELLGETRAALRDATLELRRAVIRLEEMGVELKDPLTGLVDFPSQRDGEQVELCWRLGEQQVAHWHRIGEGFAGRRPI